MRNWRGRVDAVTQRVAGLPRGQRMLALPLALLLVLGLGPAVRTATGGTEAVQPVSATPALTPTPTVSAATSSPAPWRTSETTDKSLTLSDPVTPTATTAPSATATSTPQTPTSTTSAPTSTSTSTPTSTPTPTAEKTFAVSGTITVPQESEASSGAVCGGSGEFVSLQVRTAVALVDGTGDQVGAGRITGCTWQTTRSSLNIPGQADYTYRRPVLAFTGTVAERDGYLLTAGATQIAVTYAQVRSVLNLQACAGADGLCLGAAAASTAPTS